MLNRTCATLYTIIIEHTARLVRSSSEQRGALGEWPRNLVQRQSLRRVDLCRRPHAIGDPVLEAASISADCSGPSRISPFGQPLPCGSSTCRLVQRSTRQSTSVSAVPPPPHLAAGTNHAPTGPTQVQTVFATTRSFYAVFFFPVPARPLVPGRRQGPETRRRAPEPSRSGRSRLSRPLF